MLENSGITHLLALETSGIASGVYISRDQEILGQISLYQKNIHSRRLSISVDQLLNHLELTLRDLKAIVISAGPGSFTGLRIGYSLAKGIAHSLSLKIIEIPTLDIWAYQAGKTNLPIFSFIDAHREEIFYAYYQRNQDHMKRISDYQITPLKTIPELITKKTLLTGGNLHQFEEKFRKYLGKKAVFPQVYSKQPEGWALVALGFDKYRAGEFSEYESCEPLYLRSFKGIM